jgi:hypothetical protein
MSWPTEMVEPPSSLYVSFLTTAAVEALCWSFCWTFSCDVFVFDHIDSHEEENTDRQQARILDPLSTNRSLYFQKAGSSDALVYSNTHKLFLTYTGDIKFGNVPIGLVVHHFYSIQTHESLKEKN